MTSVYKCQCVRGQKLAEKTATRDKMGLKADRKVKFIVQFVFLDSPGCLFDNKSICKIHMT